MQSFEANKCEAIRSLLPLLGTHRDLMPMALKVIRYQTVAAGEIRHSPPAWALLDCDGDCSACEFERQCQGERWESVYRWLRRAYRIPEIEDALAALKAEWPYIAKCVIDCYVEPWTGWKQEGDSEPISPGRRKRRLQWADKGVAWIADQIPGGVMGYEVVRSRPKPSERERLVIQLRIEGKSYRAIARQVGCSKNAVGAILRNGGICRERTPCAVSVDCSG